MMRRSFAVLPMLALAGCIHHRTGMPAAATTDKIGWTRGVTTQRDVVAIWGNPHKTTGDVWIWQEQTSIGGKIKASYYMIGLTVSNTAVSTREHRLTFGADGRLVDLETCDSVPDGAKWSLLPW